MSKNLIRGVVYDLDNTLLDFMKMKEFAVKAAVKGMIEAGLLLDEDQAYKEIVPGVIKKSKDPNYSIKMQLPAEA